MSSASSSSTSAYKKVIGGGLKLKGGRTITAASSSSSAPKKRVGNEEIMKLERGTEFKVKREGGPKSDSNAASASASESSSTSAAASSSVAASSRIAHPIVLSSSAATGASSWGLHKDELHEIDSHLSSLQEQDRALGRIEADAKKEIVMREKKQVEMQIKNMVNTKDLPPGVKFSIPSASSLNRDYMYRTEVVVGDATARLDERSKKKSDRMCK